MNAIAKTLCLALAAATLAATPAPPAAAADPANPNLLRAQQLYGQAELLIQQKKYGEAARLLEEAYTFDPDPSLLMNAARVYKGDNKLELGRQRYWQVAQIPNIPADMRAEALKMIAECEVEMRTAGIVFTPLPVATAPTGPAAPPAPDPVTTPTDPATPASTTPGIKSGALVPGNVPHTDRDYMLSAMTCYWNGGMGRFQNCSTTHSWAGNANFDITPGRTRVAGNGLVVAIAQSYYRKPFCSVEFQNIVSLKRIDAREGAVTIYLHDLNGHEKAWSEVSTWVTIICHGVR